MRWAELAVCICVVAPACGGDSPGGAPDAETRSSADGGHGVSLACDSFRVAVAEADAAHPRNSEGDVVALNEGRLLLGYTQYDGESDHAPARIMGRVSDNGGRDWGRPFVLAESVQGFRNAMIVGFLRLTDGRIMMGYNKQVDLGDSRYYVRMSSDEGESWSDEVSVIGESRYGFVYNFGPIQLASGRILAPYQYNRDGAYVAPGHLVVTVYRSDDGGSTWQPSPEAIDLPGRGAMEPTLVELADGSILMHLRTDLGSTYRSRSTDEGITWAPPEPTSLRNPESASALAGIPATSDLLTLYNDNYDPDGPHHEGARTPLTAAVSNDEGRTWRVTKNVESDLAFEYSYPSITFVEDRALFTYYEASQADGEWSYDQIFRSASLRWLYGECGGSP